MFQASKYVNVKNDKCQICHESHESNPMSLSDKKSVKNGCRKILLWTKYAQAMIIQAGCLCSGTDGALAKKIALLSWITGQQRHEEQSATKIRQIMASESSWAKLYELKWFRQRVGGAPFPRLTKYEGKFLTIFSVMRRYRTRVSHSVSESVTLLNRLDWCDPGE